MSIVEQINKKDPNSEKFNGDPDKKFEDKNRLFMKAEKELGGKSLKRILEQDNISYDHGEPGYYDNIALEDSEGHRTRMPVPVYMEKKFGNDGYIRDDAGTAIDYTNEWKDLYGKLDIVENKNEPPLRIPYEERIRERIDNKEAVEKFDKIEAEILAESEKNHNKELTKEQEKLLFEALHVRKEDIGKEFNKYADPTKANNGGGYSQQIYFDGKVLTDDRGNVGDFGTAGTAKAWLIGEKYLVKTDLITYGQDEESYEVLDTSDLHTVLYCSESIWNYTATTWACVDGKDLSSTSDWTPNLAAEYLNYKIANLVKSTRPKNDSEN